MLRPGDRIVRITMYKLQQAGYGKRSVSILFTELGRVTHVTDAIISLKKLDRTVGFDLSDIMLFIGVK